jgi:hypothetical protein
VSTRFIGKIRWGDTLAFITFGYEKREGFIASYSAAAVILRGV